MSQSTGIEAPSFDRTRRALIRTLAAGAVAQTLCAEASPHSPSTSSRSPTMSKIDRRIAELGITLPKPWTISIPSNLSASLVRVRGKSVFVSGHVPIDAHGSPAGPFGRVGAEVTPEQGQQAAVGAHWHPREPEGEDRRSRPHCCMVAGLRDGLARTRF